jgi:phosphoribosylamine---glycine ligase
VEQRLAELPAIQWKNASAVCVVAAAGGYPDAYEKGKVITGIQKATEQGAIVFHAGTKLEQEQIITDGGRVLGITAIGHDFEQAIASAYDAVKSIQFEEMYYRRDIGHRYKN